MATSSPRGVGRGLGTAAVPGRLGAWAARRVAAIAVLVAVGLGGATAAHADPAGEDDPVSASAGTLQLTSTPSQGRHMAAAEAGLDGITDRSRVRVAPPPSDPPADSRDGVREESRALGVELFALISVASVALGAVILFVLRRRGDER